MEEDWRGLPDLVGLMPPFGPLILMDCGLLYMRGGADYSAQGTLTNVNVNTGVCFQTVPQGLIFVNLVQ